MAAKPTPYRRADGSISWKVRFRVTPGTAPTSETFASRDQAERFARLVDDVGGAAAREARNASDSSAANVPTLMTWFAHHLELLAADTTPGTRADYQRMADRTWMPRLGRLPIDAITKDAVTQWVAWQRQQPSRSGGTYSPKSIKNAHGLLSSVLQSAMEAGVIPRNVAKGVGLPSDAADAEMEVFDQDEWADFIDAMDPWYQPLTRFLLATGCRIGEATAVQVKDLDLAGPRPTVRIRRAWKKSETGGVYLGSPKTRRGVRTLVLSPTIATELATLTRGKKAGDMVFVTPSGSRIMAQHYRNRQWARAMTAAGITKRLTPHSLRHTSASWMLQAGISPIVVQHRLGHESLQTTSKVYAHVLTDAQTDAAAFTELALKRPRQIEG